jgi:hypothetical protein
VPAEEKLQRHTELMGMVGDFGEPVAMAGVSRGSVAIPTLTASRDAHSDVQRGQLRSANEV